MIVTGIIAVDQHWGAIDPKRYRHELDLCLFNRIEHMEKLDFIMFGGDTFDMKEYVSSDTFKEILKFIKDLLKVTERLNTKIVFIEGTRNHDSLQLSTLEIVFNQIVDCDRIKFVNTVEEDEITGMSILYIPEEYVIDQDEYYEEYFKKHYDLILGHGITDKIWYASRDKSVDLNHHTTAPIFSVDKLCEIGNYVYFGHIHEHKMYGPDGRFKSVGPSTVWEYGKEWDCGYYIVEYDTHTNLMMEEFVVNENAPKLITKGLVIDSDISVDTLDKKLDDIIKISNEVDGLRIVVTIYDNIDKFEAIKDFVITKVGQHENVKLVLKIENVSEEEESSDMSEETKELSEKILGSTKTPIENQISNFILYKKGEDIPIDYIRELLNIVREDN